jgi:hypothetical protein
VQVCTTNDKHGHSPLWLGLNAEWVAFVVCAIEFARCTLLGESAH